MIVGWVIFILVWVTKFISLFIVFRFLFCIFFWFKLNFFFCKAFLKTTKPIILLSGHKWQVLSPPIYVIAQVWQKYRRTSRAQRYGILYTLPTAVHSDMKKTNLERHFFWQMLTAVLVQLLLGALTLLQNVSRKWLGVYLLRFKNDKLSTYCFENS